jgi:hypothetical protein
MILEFYIYLIYKVSTTPPTKKDSPMDKKYIQCPGDLFNNRKYPSFA